MTTKTRPRKGDRIECPECHRWVGYWPDKLDYHVAHLMPHRMGFRPNGSADWPWCDGKWYAG